MKKHRIIWKVLFAVYIFFLLYFLIFSEWYGRSGMMGEYHYNLVPFREIKRFWNYRYQLGVQSLTNLAGNVIVFMPFGFFGAAASPYRKLGVTIIDGFLLSLLIELFQLVTTVGCFDVDDLFLNTLGAMLGYIVFAAGTRKRRVYGKKRKGE